MEKYKKRSDSKAVRKGRVLGTLGYHPSKSTYFKLFLLPSLITILRENHSVGWARRKGG